MPRDRSSVTGFTGATTDLILRGTEYAISKDGYGYIKLTPVSVTADA